MWFPTHIRNGANRAALLFLTSAVCFSLTGCSWHTVFSQPTPDDFEGRLAEHIPAPDFDEADSSSRVAGSVLSRGIVSAPTQFQWSPIGESAGGRDIESITVGNGGYRVLVIGSIAGNDPNGIQLTEELARHIHENSILMGGVEATVIRTANPDGEVSRTKENDNGKVVNRQFPCEEGVPLPLAEQEPEVRTILGLLTTHQPQRVIHVRSYGESGIVAASSGASRVGKDVAEWLNLEYIALPGKSREGTLERHLSEKDNCDIITVAIPPTTNPNGLWESYGDSLLNLLLDEDFSSRKLAREQGTHSSADQRGDDYNYDSSAYDR